MKQALLNRLFATLFILIWSGLFADAQNDLRFCSSEIENLYSILPAGIKTTLHDKPAVGDNTIIFSSKLGSNQLTFSAEYNEIGELSHLGIFIIKPENTESGLLPAFQYISRSLLKWALREYNPRLFEKVPFGQSLLKINGIDAAISADQLPIGSRLRNTDLNFQITKTGSQFVASCLPDRLTEIVLEFPSDYFEISGKRKDELENELARLLATHKISENKKIHSEALQPEDLKSGLFRLAGAVYDGNEEISSDIYLTKNGSYSIVYSRKYPHESISNLLLGYAYADVRADIDFIFYDGKGILTDASLPVLLNFLGADHSAYIGWQERDQTEITASVFFVNQYYDYNHLLIVCAAVDSFFSSNQKIKATLYTYISKSGLKHQ